MPATAHVTPGNGWFVDQLGNKWALDASGHPVVNDTIFDNKSGCKFLERWGATTWQQAAYDDSWWSITPTGKITDASQLPQLWKQKPSPWPTPTPTPTPTPGAPPQAAAVGYTVRTYGPGLVMGKNWFDNGGANLTVNSDGSVTDHGGVPNTWNAHVVSCLVSGGNVSRGVAFGGGGYFECTFKFTGLPPGWGTPQAANGWPSWWATAPGLNADTAPLHVEADFVEWFCNARDVGLSPNAIGGTAAAFNSGIIDWYGQNQGTYYMSKQAGYNDTAYVPTNNDPSQYHKIGWLWVPATANSRGYCKTYFDGTQVGPTHTWDRYNGGSTPQGAGGTVPNFSSLDVTHLQLLWGTGSNNPMTVSAIEVWQASDKDNLGSVA